MAMKHNKHQLNLFTTSRAINLITTLSSFAVFVFINIQCQVILRRAVINSITHVHVPTSQVRQITVSILFQVVGPRNLTLEEKTRI